MKLPNTLNINACNTKCTSLFLSLTSTKINISIKENTKNCCSLTQMENHDMSLGAAWRIEKKGQKRANVAFNSFLLVVQIFGGCTASSMKKEREKERKLYKEKKEERENEKRGREKENRKDR